jgi:hypothetical protein
MAEKKKNPRYTTPAGIASWPRLSTPDTKFNADGTYSVKLLLDENNAEHATFLRKLDALADAALVAMKKENAKYAKVMKLVTPYAPELDKDGNETGKTVLNFTMPAIIRNKEKTKEWKLKPVVFDANLQPLPADVEVGGGSTIKVSFESWAYFNAKDKEAGITRRLLAVQVLDLKTWNGGADASSFGFEAAEGFAVNEPDTEGSSADATEGDDF